jgi:hypothetical protein
MTENLIFISRPKMKNTKRFWTWICSLLQVESGNGENIQAGSLEKFVSVYKGKGSPVTGSGGPIGWVEVQLKSFLTSALEGGLWSASRPGRLYLRQRPGTHCTGGWVGPGDGLDRCGKSRPTGIRSPDLPTLSESLYRLRYPGSSLSVRTQKKKSSRRPTYFRNVTSHLRDVTET